MSIAWAFRIALTLLLTFSTQGAFAAFMITGPEPADANPVQIFYGPGIVTYTPNPAQKIAAPGPGDEFTQTFNADEAASYPGWTLAYGGNGLGGVLNINEYKSYWDSQAAEAGVFMNATYTPGAGDPAGLTFIQYYSDSFESAPPVYHIDPFPNDDTEPMYFDAAERAADGLTFDDAPSEPTPPPFKTTTVEFYTYLCSFDANTQGVTVYDGWSWGYIVGGTGFAAPQLLQPYRSLHRSSFCLSALRDTSSTNVTADPAS